MVRAVRARNFNATIALAAMAVAVSVTSTADASDPLLRFPDVHEDTVVFVNAEDIWTAPADGGFARRPTDDEGEERHPKFSPDGSLVPWVFDYYTKLDF